MNHALLETFDTKEHEESYTNNVTNINSINREQESPSFALRLCC